MKQGLSFSSIHRVYEARSSNDTLVLLQLLYYSYDFIDPAYDVVAGDKLSKA